MATISKTKLKTYMLKIFRELEQTGEELIVTDHDKPVLKIIPINQKFSTEELFKDYLGKVIYNENINEPTTGEWDIM